MNPPIPLGPPPFYLDPHHSIGTPLLCEVPLESWDPPPLTNSPPPLPPQDLRRKAARLVAAKCTLAARVDSFHESHDGKVGPPIAPQ